jgi:thioredoxin-related protein
MGLERAILLHRRTMIAGLSATALCGKTPLARAAALLGEDGLYHMDWYIESFLEVADDLAAATRSGKRFAVLWGLRGCPACKRMHLEHLAQAPIADYIRTNFDVLHLNILGSREVTDFDGARLTEKAFAERYGIRGTPAVQFFPEQAAAAKPPAEREVARLAGLPPPAEFHAMFRYVREKAYESGSFETYLKNLPG